MRCALLPPKIPFGECWQAEYPRWPIRSHRSVAAHSSPLPTVQGFLARLDKLAFDIPDSAVKSLKDNLSLWLGLSKLAATEIGPIMTKQESGPLTRSFYYTCVRHDLIAGQTERFARSQVLMGS